VAIQQVADSEERLLLVGNLYEDPISNLSFSFFNPHAHRFPALLEIDGIALPPKIFHLWHAHKAITRNVRLVFITAEIYAVTDHPYQIFARYYDLSEIQIALRVPLSLPSSIHIISGEGVVSEKMQKDAKYKVVLIKSHTPIQFEVAFADSAEAEGVIFTIEKSTILGD